MSGLFFKIPKYQSKLVPIKITIERINNRCYWTMYILCITQLLGSPIYAFYLSEHYRCSSCIVFKPRKREHSSAINNHYLYW